MTSQPTEWDAYPWYRDSERAVLGEPSLNDHQPSPPPHSVRPYPNLGRPYLHVVPVTPLTALPGGGGALGASVGDYRSETVTTQYLRCDSSSSTSSNLISLFNV